MIPRCTFISRPNAYIHPSCAFPAGTVCVSLLSVDILITVGPSTEYTITLSDLNHGIVHLIFDEHDDHDDHREIVLIPSEKPPPLKALALVNRKLADQVRPHLFRALSVPCPYNSAATFLDGRSKTLPGKFAKSVRQVHVLALSAIPISESNPATRPFSTSVVMLVHAPRRTGLTNLIRDIALVVHTRKPTSMEHVDVFSHMTSDGS